MNLGFKDQFVPFVEDGSKTHTIRAGNRWKAGMRADLYARPRQKGMRLLFRAPVVRVETIEIMCFPDRRADGYPSAELSPLHAQTEIVIEGIALSRDGLNDFAFRDGFRDQDAREKPTIRYLRQMVEFWRKENGFGSRTFCFEGQIIHWDYARRFDVGGMVSDQQLEDAIAIYGYLPVRQNVARVPQSRRKAIEAYCYKSHLRAADNRVRVPKKPEGFDLLIATPGCWSEACGE